MSLDLMIRYFTYQNVKNLLVDENQRIFYLLLKFLCVKLKHASLLGFQRRQKIARGVTCGLSLLHQQGFVHGEVNPQNVGVKADGSGVLLCPDFSRSLVSIQKYVSPLH